MSTLINNATAVGKTGKVIIWLVVVNAIVAGLSVLLNDPTLLSPKVQGVLLVVNSGLVLIKNILDPKVKNV